MVDDIDLLAYTLLVDTLEDGGYKLGIQSTERPFGTVFFKNLPVAASLKDGHVVILLVLTDFAAYAHSSG